MARLDVMETFHGVSFPGHLHTQESLQRALNFPFQDTDILIVSYPKSGKKKGQTDQDTVSWRVIHWQVGMLVGYHILDFRTFMPKLYF